MTRTRWAWLSVVAFAAGVATATACNTLLDNERGVLDAADATVDDAGIPSADGAVSCGAGTKPCFGQCVPIGSPLFGCTATSCESCSLPHVAAPLCVGPTCAIDTSATNAGCRLGYADCDDDAGDGCEADLTLPAHCGICNLRCTSPAKFCVDAQRCSDTCPKTTCGDDCIDPKTSVEHCGDCATACTPPANGGSVACEDGGCVSSCEQGAHVCRSGDGGATCRSDVDTSACGPSCVTCPSGVNAATVCNGTTGRCEYACAPHFGDCDPAVAGCESWLDNTAKHCGACGVVCTAVQKCCHSQCVPIAKECP